MGLSYFYVYCKDTKRKFVVHFINEPYYIIDSLDVKTLLRNAFFMVKSFFSKRTILIIESEDNLLEAVREELVKAYDAVNEGLVEHNLPPINIQRIFNQEDKINDKPTYFG